MHVLLRAKLPWIKGAKVTAYVKTRVRGEIECVLSRENVFYHTLTYAVKVTAYVKTRVRGEIECVLSGMC
jgi:hypothetical protein